ncbi:MAG: hypothetical protein AAAC47_00675, partial [Pararhizobium sp.]
CFFKAGETWRIKGTGPFPAANPHANKFRWIHYVDTGQAQWWIGAGLAGCAVTDGTNVYDITPTAWIAPQQGTNVQVGDLNTIPFINHPEVGPFYWDLNPVAIAQPLPGWPVNQRAGVMRAHKNFLIAGNIDTAVGLLENEVHWSVSAVPGDIPATWVPAPTNDAGDMSFAVPGGPILDLLSIRDQVFVSKSNYTGAMQYTGGQYVFQRRDVFPNIGIFATGAQVEYGGVVYMLSGAIELIRHDGNAPQNLSLGSYQDYIRKAINMEFPASVFLYRDQDEGQIVIAYPAGATDACTEGLAYEGATGDICPRDLPNVYSVGVGLTAITPSTWDPDLEAWDLDNTSWNEAMSGFLPAHICYGTADGMVEEGQGDGLWVGGASQPIAAFCERTNLDFGEWGRTKIFMDFWPIADGAIDGLMTYKFGTADTANDPVTWSYQQELPVNDSGKQDLDAFGLNGRLMAYGFASNGGGAWRSCCVKILARLGGKV